MPIASQSRQRLAALMDQRRGELRLRWRDVAALSGMSYEGIRAIRNGGGDMRLLTQRGIEDALRWEYGSIKMVLDGGDPQPRAEAGSGLPPMTEAERRDVLAYLEFRRAAASRGA